MHKLPGLPEGETETLKKANGLLEVIASCGQPLQGSHEYGLFYRPPGCFSPVQNTSSWTKTCGYISLMSAAGPEDMGCSCQMPNREQGKGHWRSGRGYAEGQVGAFPAPENYWAGRRPNTECCTKQKDKVKLQEAILGQNDPASSVMKEERKDEGVATRGCRRTVSLQAGAQAVRSHCRSHRDQLQQLLQVLNGI